MPTLLIINTTCNYGSTGHIAESVGRMAMQEGWKVWYAHGGRYVRPSQLRTILIQSRWAEWLHVLWSKMTGRHGLGSYWATKRLIRRIEQIRPDLIHLHNIHGYYLHYPLLMRYLQLAQIPVIWTLHDCWAITGHCAFFNTKEGMCDRWKTGCGHCPKLADYPASWIDRSKQDYALKQQYFASLPRMTLVPVSEWVAKQVAQSFLRSYPIQVLHNGVDLAIFRPYAHRMELRQKWHIDPQAYVILGVASPWIERKGYSDLIAMHDLPHCQVVMVGLSIHQCQQLPDSIIGITRTDSAEELAELYSLADIFVNPTYSDTYPTTNIEALACGTGVITYNTDGSPESVTPQTGMVVERGNRQALREAILHVQAHPLSSAACRQWAEQNADQKQQFAHYIDLYRRIV